MIHMPTATDEKKWDMLKHGMHICSIYRNHEEQFSPILPFFRYGFDNKEKCVYVFDQEPPQPIYTEFDHVQNFPRDFKTARQIEVIPYEDVYTKEGAFDPDKTMSLFNESVTHSHDQGYSGLRVAGEMGWTLLSGTPISKLIQYELKLNTFFPNKDLIGICQYHEASFDRDILTDIICTHPYVILYGKIYENKYFYTSPEYVHNPSRKLRPEYYETMVSILLEQEPMIG